MSNQQYIKSKALRSDSFGMVSIIVTVIIMTILGLIVLGFGKISRREQRQTLDRQLNTQAYYAAESGVNDAIDVINGGSFDTDKDYSSDCSLFINDYNLNRNLDASGTVSYTCLLVDSTPSVLEYGNVSNTSKIIPLQTIPGNIRFGRVDISWQDTSGSSDFSGCTTNKGNWPQTTGWICKAGVIRADLFRTGGGPYDNFKLGDLGPKTMTAFLLPQSSRNDGNLPFNSYQGYDNAGVVWYVQCVPGVTATKPKRCTASINMDGGTSYMLRLRSLYLDSAVSILAYDASGNRIELSGVQAQVDSTGKANDVLRRIQVRVPLNNFAGPFPDFALQSTEDICKRLIVIPNSVTGQTPPQNCDPSF